MSKLALVTAPLFLMTACAGFPFFNKSNPQLNEKETLQLVCGAQDPSRAELELLGTQYDGHTLSGRLLIGAASGRICLDKRLIVNVSVNVESVRDCATGLPATFIHADSFPKHPRPEDLVLLSPGYWYGRQVHLRLFSPLHGQRGPDCMEVALSIFSARDALLGRINVRAAIPTEPAAPAGTPTDAQLSPNPESAP